MAECYNKIYLKEKDIEVSCGKCLNCLENKKKEKAIRLVHEMNNYKFKTFITITMDEIRATRNKAGMTEVSKKDLKSYIRKLQYYDKEYLKISNEKRMKYVACAEYGELTERAHYHLVILHNTFLQFKMKSCWKRGHVRIEAIKDVRALYYTVGYTDKKQQDYFKDKYKRQKEEREAGFLIASRGNGAEWIKEAIATKKVNKHQYFIESMQGKHKLPNYYKTKIKEYIMGVKARYRRLTDEERQFRKEHFGDERKTVMVNENSYYNNYWKWNNYIKCVNEEAKQRDPIYYKEEALRAYRDNWKQRLYNLMYNEKYEEMDGIEREYTELFKRRRELLKIKAEQKWFNKRIKRKAI